MNGEHTCLLATVESDAHMWNLVYLQLWLSEHGVSVKNLGSCTPVEDILQVLAQGRTQLLVISSVNGHGHYQGLALIEEIRRRYPNLPCVIGGKLTTSQDQTRAVRQQLLTAGFDQVFIEADAIAAFECYLDTFKKRARPPFVLGTDTALSWT
ncbi:MULTISPECIES: cobalamin B12-binding domain-containing protein [Pseudomonas]|uniref:Cobalamin-dependent protein n=1 Tax=Pseudomonas auratipiscis TaxID=3115853 RepID=A0AB35WN15_9PSED|nr:MULTISPECIES: cobalamin-dependent protein [unclassified Pseudomonas]MEE1866005.1 cobalamin-dependent protein [Pseudomonas sp. 120P]MEE1956826.1 cobalamin-dependent protein [Pseudomonas sp. 119P]